MSNDKPDGPRAQWTYADEPPPHPPPDARTQEAAPPGHDLLTVKQRAAILRGCRMRLSQLHDECEALHMQGDQMERLQAVLDEIATLEEGIAWMWRYTIV